MNQITTRYITENGACYEQYVITDPEAKTALTITPERGGMITSFTLDGEEFVWTRRPNFSECNRPRFGVPVLFPNCGNPDNGVHIFDGKAYPMENHGFADLCAWDVESVGPDGVTLILESTPLTKFLYPFDFTVLMNYNLEGNTAAINMTVINEGDTNMPFSFGFHPYFKASKLENVAFDIHCATCSESAKGEQPAAPEKITLTRKEGADNSVRLLTGVQTRIVSVSTGCAQLSRAQRDALIAAGYRLWDATLDAGDEKGTAARAYAETAQRFSETDAAVVLRLHHSAATAEALAALSAYMTRQGIPSGTISLALTPINGADETR